MTTLAERIRKRLVALGHDPEDGGQTWLAKEVGMTQPGINAILTGRSKRPRFLKEISEALATSEAYLLGETDDPTPVDRIPRKVREAIEAIPGGPLTDSEARPILEIAGLIARSRRD